MSYCVEYNPELKNRYPELKKPRMKLPVGALFCSVAVIAALYVIGTSGALRYLIPGDPDVTTAALETLVNEIGAGESVREAFVDFCKEIIFSGT